MLTELRFVGIAHAANHIAVGVLSPDRHVPAAGCCPDGGDGELALPPLVHLPLMSVVRLATRLIDGLTVALMAAERGVRTARCRDAGGTAAVALILSAVSSLVSKYVGDKGTASLVRTPEG